VTEQWSSAYRLVSDDRHAVSWTRLAVGQPMKMRWKALFCFVLFVIYS